MAVAGIPAPAEGCAGFPRKRWLCAAGSDTAGPGSMAAVAGVIPGSLTISPWSGLTLSMRLEVSTPPLPEGRGVHDSTAAVVPAGAGAVFPVWAGNPPDPIRSVKPRDLARGPPPEAARKPYPTPSWNEIPPAIMIGQPTPRFSANPGIAPAGVPAPLARLSRAPSRKRPRWDSNHSLPLARRTTCRIVGGRSTHKWPR